MALDSSVQEEEEEIGNKTLQSHKYALSFFSRFCAKKPFTISVIKYPLTSMLSTPL